VLNCRQNKLHMIGSCVVQYVLFHSGATLLCIPVVCCKRTKCFLCPHLSSKPMDSKGDITMIFSYCCCVIEVYFSSVLVVVRFGVHTAVSIKIVVFLDAAPCNLVHRALRCEYWLPISSWH
jgi:hypothetical protein